uniref:Ig-like domain-containing protein n=1 Tax=Meleagris gallopavo TaxID=9103 RepID=G1N5X4_MELGA
MLDPLTTYLVCTACRAQPVLTQPAAVQVLPGETAQLFCVLSPQYNISDFGITWYQQCPGQALRYLLYYNSERDKHKPATIPDRFSATKDLARNASTLTITGVQAEDEAVYYCGGYDSSSNPGMVIREKKQTWEELSRSPAPGVAVAMLMAGISRSHLAVSLSL